MIGLSYVGAPATPKDGEVSAFDNGVHGGCAQEFRTSIYKLVHGETSLRSRVDAYNNTIDSYDVAWADWKSFAGHKEKTRHTPQQVCIGGIAQRLQKLSATLKVIRLMSGGGTQWSSLHAIY